ncbi:hypothetical protein [Microbacterium atlanticum]|uniref:hypothetical protein n=1 Tax=Microbacterium atlanticum TaxID=2782168 RepID=UPI0018872DC1|nr:hypothetical protein [Microbacterium atlanticum]
MSLVVESAWSGWSGDTIVELSDGTIWQQDEYLYEYRYSYRPAVSIANRMMSVDGMSRPVRVKALSADVRRTIAGAWKGWDGKTTVEFTDGSRWEQAEYHYEYRYAYRPKAFFVDGNVLVEDMSKAVRVRRAR